MASLVPWAAPALPVEVEQLVGELTSPDAETRRLALLASPPTDRAAIEAALAAHEAEDRRPLPQALLRRWLGELFLAVRNPPGEDELITGRLAGLAKACGELPGAVLTETVIAKSLRLFEFWPSVAELAGLLERHAAERRARASALRRILAMMEPRPAQPPPRPPPSPAEEAAVESAMGPVRAAAQRFAEADRAVGRRLGARHASPEQLRQLYAQRDDALAKARLRGLGPPDGEGG